MLGGIGIQNTCIHKRPHSQTLVKIPILVLRCKNFVFNGLHYLQTQGAAMRTKTAPTYANMHMSHLKTFNNVNNHEVILTSITTRSFSLLIFIDGLDMKWSHGHVNIDTGWILTKLDRNYPCMVFF